MNNRDTKLATARSPASDRKWKQPLILFAGTRINKMNGEEILARHSRCIVSCCGCTR